MPSIPLHPLRRRARALAPVLALACAALPAACGGGSDAEPVTALQPAFPAAITVVDGSGQTAAAGAALPAALRVRVASQQGTPVANVTVVFAVTSGTATVAPASAVTDAQGIAATQLTLGAAAGPVVVTASVQGASLGATFTATATAAAPVVSAACGDPSPLPALGQPAVLGTVATLCLPGGSAGAEYALVAMNAADSAATRAILLIKSAGIDTLATPAGATDRALTGLHAALRTAESEGLRPRMAAARRALAERAESRADVGRTPAVGELVTLSANLSNACAASRLRVGRVAAVGAKAIVVADTGNPAGGLGSADFTAAAATFDTLVAPFAEEAFGTPSDVDGNGKVVLFFTRVVNELVPAAGGFYDAGLFLTRDLFPRTAADPAGACAASNAGEMLYLMVPDPRGTINRNTVATATVTGGLTRTLVHEYQHLINASRRLYGTAGAEDWEDAWLDEGLSHVAEELLFYRVSGLAPRHNLDAAAVRGTAAPARAFEALQLGNLGRLREYLGAPSRNSPYAEQDSPAARGAAWSFLRYAADRVGGDEAALWRRLVAGPASGMANLRAAFGTEPGPLLRDWATSLFADEMPGAPATVQQPSWNLPSQFAGVPVAGPYPLTTLSLAGASPLALALPGGGAAYLRFAVPAGSAGTVYWDALPAYVHMTLVRTR